MGQVDHDVVGTRWMGLRWSAWMPLMAAHPLAMAQLPSDPGYYRIREVSARGALVWIGASEMGVRQVIERLSRQVHLPSEPYDDPGSPARALWWLRQNRASSFEVSGAVPSPSDDSLDSGVELMRAAYRNAIMGKDARG